MLDVDYSEADLPVVPAQVEEAAEPLRLPPLRRPLVQALRLTLVLTLLTGVIYPLLLFGLAQGLFAPQANGSIIEQNGQVVGSEWIGQAFTSPDYFWGRPSATGPSAYNAALSSGSNLGPNNPALEEAVQIRIEALRAADPDNALPIPVDLVTASGSGLDPHISPAAAAYQVSRIAQARNITPEEVQALIDEVVEPRQFGFLGEARVNVLRLNRLLDERFGA